MRSIRPYKFQEADMPDYSDIPACDDDGQLLLGLDQCCDEPEPTHHRPGSCEKVDVLADRFERGQPLFVADDANVFPGAVFEELI